MKISNLVFGVKKKVKVLLNIYLILNTLILN